MNSLIDGWMDGWMDRWMDGWMDIYLSINVTGDTFISNGGRLVPLKDRSVTAAMIMCSHDDILHIMLVFCMRNELSHWLHHYINNMPLHCK